MGLESLPLRQFVIGGDVLSWDNLLLGHDLDADPSLASETEASLVAGGELAALPVRDVVCDSRKVSEQTIFVAISGYETDGHNYIPQALDRKAQVIVMEKGHWSNFWTLAQLTEWSRTKGALFFEVDNSRRSLARLSAIMYDYPWRNIELVGVTGTNGKTSVTYILEHIWNYAGRRAGVIGTINYRWPGYSQSSSNTTPESRQLTELVANMRRDSVASAVMEVSSHALYLERVSAMDFAAAVFTNLSQDHLDFHANMEEYFLAKVKLFEPELLHGPAVIWVGDDYGRRLASRLLAKRQTVMGLDFVDSTFAYDGGGDYHAYGLKDLRYNLERTEFTLVTPDGSEKKLGTHLKGRFNVFNTALAVLAAVATGIPWQAIAEALNQKDLSVPGRFEVVGEAESLGFLPVVDYAHTPDALDNLLQAARKLEPRRLLTVFGCGGDRDKGKRPKMGRIAAELSDYTIVTSDNPRTEDPEQIIKEIIEPLGDYKERFEVISDRRKAIERSAALVKPGDILLVAGKGHEDYQILGQDKIHFDDREELRQALSHSYYPSKGESMC